MDSIQSLPSFIITILIFSHSTSVYTCQKHNCSILLNGEKCISIGKVLIWFLQMKTLRSIPKQICGIQRHFMWDKCVYLPYWLPNENTAISLNYTSLVTGTTSAVQLRILFPYQSPINQKILWLSHKFSSIFLTLLCLWSKKILPCSKWCTLTKRVICNKRAFITRKLKIHCLASNVKEERQNGPYRWKLGAHLGFCKFEFVPTLPSQFSQSFSLCFWHSCSAFIS